jgi:hypothetical protein
MYAISCNFVALFHLLRVFNKNYTKLTTNKIKESVLTTNFDVLKCIIKYIIYNKKDYVYIEKNFLAIITHFLKTSLRLSTTK